MFLYSLFYSLHTDILKQECDLRNAKCILGYLTVPSPHHGHIGLAASPTRKKNNLRSLQQRNTLSMRISMFPVQYTLHWAGGARAPLAPPDELSRKKQARVA